MRGSVSPRSSTANPQMASVGRCISGGWCRGGKAIPFDAALVAELVGGAKDAAGQVDLTEANIIVSGRDGRTG